MTAILTDEQIVTLLATEGGREAMLQEAARLGMEIAANICEESSVSTHEFGTIYLTERMEEAKRLADAIRAAVGE
jgi:hypothetical protein